MKVRRIRADLQVRAMVAIALFYFTGMTGVVFLPGSQLDARGLFLVWVLFAVPLLPLAWRSSKLAVWMDDGGITVVNFLRSRRIGWDEIDRFELNRSPYSVSISGLVVGKDGSVLPMTALQARWLQSVERARRRSVAQRGIDQLNEELRRRRATSRPRHEPHP